MSSKRHIRKKSCTGKVQHETLGAGWKQIGRLRKIAGSRGHLHVYACSFCRFFHVGHRSRQAARSAAAR